MQQLIRWHTIQLANQKAETESRGGKLVSNSDSTICASVSRVFLGVGIFHAKSIQANLRNCRILCGVRSGCENGFKERTQEATQQPTNRLRDCLENSLGIDQSIQQLRTMGSKKYIVLQPEEQGYITVCVLFSMVSLRFLFICFLFSPSACRTPSSCPILGKP